MTTTPLAQRMIESGHQQKRLRRRSSHFARREALVSYVFLLPWLIGTLVFLVGPMVFSLYLSMTDWTMIAAPNWVGLANYQEMLFQDYRFWQSLRVTGVYIVLSVPVYIIVGLAGALLLNLKLWGMRLFRTILFLPSVLSGVAVAVLWLQLLNPDLGIINQFLRAIGIARPPLWFNDPNWAVPALVITGLWGVFGGGAIIYLAGLQNISPSLYEAARLDGANVFQLFRHITIPMLTPTLFFVVLTSLIGAFQIFDTAFVIGGSRGGFSDSLLFYLLYMWQSGFRDGRLGYASALGWVLFLIAGIVVLVLMRTSERWVYYETDPNKA
jgi:multiple sugar transport system permease protein